MSRLSLLISIPAVVVSLIFLSSCMESPSPTAPDDLTSRQASHGTCLGVFQIIPGENLSTARIEPVRSPQFDVTKWAEIEILDAVWDAVNRTWTVTVEVRNPTPITGWGVQAVFTELGYKSLVWPDGFVWLDLQDPPADLERYPFFAIEKTTPQREFPGLHSCVQDLVFHFPEGVDVWKPISFFIDAHLGGPRPEPIAEDLATQHFDPPCEHDAVTARVLDHQSGGAELEVWLDLTAIQGDDHVPMYDDGEHADGEAGDGVFGAEFEGNHAVGPPWLVVYACDPQGNAAENDVQYDYIKSQLPFLPPFKTLFIGEYCELEEERLEVIRDQASWEAFWAEFSPWDMSAPEVDFEVDVVIAVCIGERPNNCYRVEITDRDFSEVNCGLCVYYTETVPGPNCGCDQVIMSPYHLITQSCADYDIMFDGDIYVDPCDGAQDPVAVASAVPHGQTVCDPIHFFDDGSYDPDGGDIVLFEWDWNNDGVYDEEGPDGYHAWNELGTFYVQFRVTDDESATDDLDQPLEITTTNALPTAHATASEYSVEVDEVIEFDGGGSEDNDCDGQSIVMYEWDWDFDGVFSTDDTGPILSHSYAEEGLYEVQLRVTDDEGAGAMLEEPLVIDVSVGPSDPCLKIYDLASHWNGRSEQQTLDVIYDEAAWKAWWMSSVGMGNPPAVDFDNFMVIAVNMGVKNTSGYYPTVDSACLDDSDELEIIVGRHIPGAGCIVLPVITHPYAAYRAERSAAPYYWTTYNDVYKCD